MNDQITAVNKLLEAGEPGNITKPDTNGYMGYDPQAIIDAINEVFGIGNWGFSELSSETVDNDKGTLAVAQMSVWIAGIDFKPFSWGQSRVTRGDTGDARKGAQTDALKKALSYFSIGNRAYHGLLKDASSTTKSYNTGTSQTGATQQKTTQQTQATSTKTAVQSIKQQAQTTTTASSPKKTDAQRLMTPEQKSALTALSNKVTLESFRQLRAYCNILTTSSQMTEDEAKVLLDMGPWWEKHGAEWLVDLVDEIRLKEIGFLSEIIGPVMANKCIAIILKNDEPVNTILNMDAIKILPILRQAAHLVELADLGQADIAYKQLRSSVYGKGVNSPIELFLPGVPEEYAKQYHAYLLEHLGETVELPPEVQKKVDADRKTLKIAA